MIQSYSNEVVYSRLPLPGMDTPCQVFIIASLVLISTAFIAYGFRGDKGSMPAKGANASTAVTPMLLTSVGIAPFSCSMEPELLLAMSQQLKQS
jgi:hypothetical protein